MKNIKKTILTLFTVINISLYGAIDINEQIKEILPPSLEKQVKTINNQRSSKLYSIINSLEQTKLSSDEIIENIKKNIPKIPTINVDQHNDIISVLFYLACHFKQNNLEDVFIQLMKSDDKVEE